MARVNPDEFLAKLDKQDENEVRNHLAAGNIYGGDKQPIVVEWLRRKDQERSDVSERRNEASQSEQIEIARSAKDAAWAAAEAARTANTRATIALVIATISATALIIDMTLRWLG